MEAALNALRHGVAAHIRRQVSLPTMSAPPLPDSASPAGAVGSVFKHPGSAKGQRLSRGGEEVVKHLLLLRALVVLFNTTGVSLAASISKSVASPVVDPIKHFLFRSGPGAVGLGFCELHTWAMIVEVVGDASPQVGVAGSGCHQVRRARQQTPLDDHRAVADVLTTPTRHVAKPDDGHDHASGNSRVLALHGTSFVLGNQSIDPIGAGNSIHGRRPC